MNDVFCSCDSFKYFTIAYGQLFRSAVVYVFSAFFFFKQKTAYEMRISDWSSDVCSSDLLVERQPRQPAGLRVLTHFLEQHFAQVRFVFAQGAGDVPGIGAAAEHVGDFIQDGDGDGVADRIDDGVLESVDEQVRSEEHTSELQSLMRSSYAVFCLKKK